MAEKNNVPQMLPKTTPKRTDTDEDSFGDDDDGKAKDVINEDLMKDFLPRVASVKKNMDLIETCNNRINELASRRVDTPVTEEEKRISEEIGNIISKSETAREEIKQVFDYMDADIDATSNKLSEKGQAQDSPELRSKRQTANTLRLKFQELLQRTNEAQVEFKKNAQNKIKRQLKIVKPELSEPELEELSKDADAGKKLISDMVMGPHATLSAAVSDIKQKYEDVLRLERSVMQVHKMFEDLAVLVHEQVLMMDNIEHNVKAANNFLERGEKHLIEAKKWYQQSRTVF